MNCRLLAQSMMGCFLLNAYAFSNSSGLEIKEGLNAGTSTQAQTERTEFLSGLRLIPQLSYVNISSLVLSNDYFEVAHSDNFRVLPMVTLDLSKQLANLGLVDFFVVASVGYTHKQGTYRVISRATGEPYEGVIRLHWLPISVGAGLESSRTMLGTLKPWVRMGAGGQWLNQTGTLNGIKQNFWIPFYTVSGGMTLFASENAWSWFGGISLGALLKTGISGTQNIRVWSLDLGTVIIV